MELMDKTNVIIIGRYNIYKMSLMSDPSQLYVTTSETEGFQIYESYKLFEVLRNEGLDTKSLRDYVDEMNKQFGWFRKITKQT